MKHKSKKEQNKQFQKQQNNVKDQCIADIVQINISNNAIEILDNKIEKLKAKARACDEKVKFLRAEAQRKTIEYSNETKQSEETEKGILALYNQIPLVYNIKDSLATEINAAEKELCELLGDIKQDTKNMQAKSHQRNSVITNSKNNDYLNGRYVATRNKKNFEEIKRESKPKLKEMERILASLNTTQSNKRPSTSMPISNVPQDLSIKQKLTRPVTIQQFNKIAQSAYIKGYLNKEEMDEINSKSFQEKLNTSITQSNSQHHRGHK